MQIFDAVRPQPEPTINQPLAELINPRMPGWTVEDLPLAQTEEGIARVGEILDFDDYVSRIYTRGDTQIILYVAYWKPGSTSVKQAHEHTPDICWVANGWTPTKREHQIDLDKVFLADAHPAEYRVFKKQGQEQSVVFWHIVGDQIYFNESSGTDAITGNFLKTLTQFGINQKREQFFVRISSNKNIRKILKGDSTHSLLADLSRTTKISTDTHARRD